MARGSHPTRASEAAPSQLEANRLQTGCKDAFQRSPQHTARAYEARYQPQLMPCMAPSRHSACGSVVQPTEGLACLLAEEDGHCQQHTGLQEACSVAGNRLVRGIEAGSRDGRSSGDPYAAAATMQRAAIMRSRIRAKV